MSVADPFVPSWPLYSPASPLDKLSPPHPPYPVQSLHSLPPATRIDSFAPPAHPHPSPPHLNAGQLLHHLTQLGLLHRLPAGVTGGQELKGNPIQPQAQRLGRSPLTSPPLHGETPPPHLNAQQLQLLAQLQGLGAPSPLQSSPSPASPPYTRTHPIQPKPISPQHRPARPLPVPLSSSPSTASSHSPPTASTSVELGTVLLSYLTSIDLQRGLLYVSRLWRFRALYVLQSRQVNIQVQLMHLYLGPFRPSNMLELVFSSKVELRSERPQPPRTPRSYPMASALTSPVIPARATPTAALCASPASVARATVCAPVASTQLVQAKEIPLTTDASALLASPARPLSKKKMREAALLADSQYNSIIECGILLSSFPPTPPHRAFKQWCAFFNKQVEVYTAVNDPTGQILYRASALADKFDYATNKVGMYLSRRRLSGGGIYQATGFRCKPPGRTGLKCGGYFLTIEACKEFENHFQYGGLTEEQRKEKIGAGAGGMTETREWEEGREESEGEEEDKAVKVKMEGGGGGTQVGLPLSTVVHQVLPQSPSFSASPLSFTKKRHLSESSQRAEGDSDVSSHLSSFKRVKSDDSSGSDSGGRASSDGSNSGSDTLPSTSSLDKRSRSGSGSEGEFNAALDTQSPAQSTRSSNSNSSNSVHSSTSSHRSAFKAPSSYRQTSFNGLVSSSSIGAIPLAQGGNDSISPPPSLPEMSASTSPGSLSGMLGYGGLTSVSPSTMPSVYASTSPSSSSSTCPSYPFNSFPPPLFSPTPVSYMQSCNTSPPLAVSHQFNALSLQPQPPVVPLGYQQSAGLEAAFTSALMQRPQVGMGGGEVSVGSNGLLNINNLTLPQLQALLGVSGGGQSLMNHLILQQQQQQHQYGV